MGRNSLKKKQLFRMSEKRILGKLCLIGTIDVVYKHTNRTSVSVFKPLVLGVGTECPQDRGPVQTT